MTKVQLELLTNISMLILTQSGKNEQQIHEKL